MNRSEILNMLDAGDIGSRCGRTRYGYVELSEAAWKMFEEAMNPFIDDMEERQEGHR